MICKKCMKKAAAEAPIKETTERKCKICKKLFKSRFLVICGDCQSTKKYCTMCGKEIEPK